MLKKRRAGRILRVHLNFRVSDTCGRSTLTESVQHPSACRYMYHDMYSIQAPEGMASQMPRTKAFLLFGKHAFWGFQLFTESPFTERFKSKTHAMTHE